MPDLLDFKVLSYTAATLDIKIKNTSGAALEKALVILLNPPKALMGTAIKTAAEEARSESQGRKKLTGIVTSPTTFSVWATAGETNDSVGIMFKNDLTDAGVKVTPPNKLETNAEFTISIPLDPTAPRAGITTFPYACKHGTGSTAISITDTLELKSGATQWAPAVTFETNQPNPTAIAPPGIEVTISWDIQNAVSATLRGPVPGGNVALTLGTTHYPFRNGELKIRAVGPTTYLLQAEVKNPTTSENVQVVKVLALDIRGSQQNGYIKASPDRVLPYGPVQINWAAWGVSRIKIDIGGAATDIPLTEMTLSGDYQGKGMLPVTAGQGGPKESEETKAFLQVAQGPAFEAAKETSFRIISWRTMKDSIFTGTPVGVAVAGSVMGLLTTQGLWTANVGINDFDPINYDLDPQLDFTKKVSATPKAWLAIAAFGNKFAVLRQTNENAVQVVLYTAAGAVDGVPIDLPGDWQPLVSRGGAVIDMAVFGGRVYVVAENQQRRACSVVFQGDTKTREEPGLQSLIGFRLLAFDEVLYALNRDSGKMFRFTLTTDGKLEARKAASAVTQSSGSQVSMIKQGMFVPVGHVMAVLSPSALPSLASLAAFNVQNVFNYEMPSLLGDAVISQDLVYNPQQDLWSRCGHGLKIEPGMICCFRDGSSKRLWVIGPQGKTYTLTVSTEHLFAHNYDLDTISKSLPLFLKEKIECKILNNTNLQFGPLDETCYKAGLTPFSSTSLVEMSPSSINLRPGTEDKFEIGHGGDSPTITMRFLVQQPAGSKTQEFLELTLSGTNLSTATTVFKRITVDSRGTASIAELPETRQQQPTSGQILILPRALTMRIVFHNATPYQLWLRSPEAPDQSARAYNGEEITINYSIPSFSIYAHGAGEFVFEINSALPHGMEIKQPNVSQTQRIRVDYNKSQALRLDLASFSASDPSASYQFALSHRIENSLPGVYIGDGMSSGETLYVPLASAQDASKSDVLKIKANDLKIEKSVSLDGSGIFSQPNSIAVVPDQVIAIVRGIAGAVLTNELALIGGQGFFSHDIITTLKTTSTKVFTMGFKIESRNPVKYSCSIADFTLGSGALNTLSLDQQKGFRTARVAGAPAWVSPLTNSPMDLSGDTAAVCVEGGLFLIKLSTKSVTEIKLEGTGREEAVLVDLRDNGVFCAHSTATGHGLIVTWISIRNPQDKLSHTFFSPIHEMLTNKNPPATPNLTYKSPRPASLAVVQDQLVVSHGRTISVLNKRDMRELRHVTVDLPCRLISAQLGTPPGESHPKYGAPREGYFVWAIGGTYEGNGQTRDNYKTSIYKLAIRR